MVETLCTIMKYGDMNIACIHEPYQQALLETGQKRFVARLKDSTLHCALNFTNALGHFIYVSKKVIVKNELKPGDKISITFEEDKSPHQFSIPEAFSEVLNTDPEAGKIFNSLTPGRRRSIITLISRVKNIDLQIEKSLRIAENLKAGRTDPRKFV